MLLYKKDLQAFYGPRQKESNEIRTHDVQLGVDFCTILVGLLSTCLIMYAKDIESGKNLNALDPSSRGWDRLIIPLAETLGTTGSIVVGVSAQHDKHSALPLLYFAFALLRYTALAHIIHPLIT